MTRLQVFPVIATSKGAPSFSDDWGAPRSGGRTHQGNDIFADKGTPLLAVDDGNVRFGVDPLGGNIASLVGQDKTRYYYAHLDAFEGANRAVKAGEIVGYLGKTGNAASTPPHLHFEVHPDGGAAVDPFPFLKAAPVVTEQRRTIVEAATSQDGIGGAIKYVLFIVGGFAIGYAATHLWQRKQ